MQEYIKKKMVRFKKIIFMSKKNIKSENHHCLICNGQAYYFVGGTKRELICNRCGLNYKLDTNQEAILNQLIKGFYKKTFIVIDEKIWNTIIT